MMYQASLIAQSSSIEILSLELDMRDIAYASIVWSFQDWELSEYIQALSDKHEEVLESYSNYSQVAGYSDERIRRLQIIVSAMGEEKIIDFWTVLQHVFNFLFGENF